MNGLKKVKAAVIGCGAISRIYMENLMNPSAHYGVIKTLLEHGKHVYTEKVLAADIDEARELASTWGSIIRLQ